MLADLVDSSEMMRSFIVNRAANAGREANTAVAQGGEYYLAYCDRGTAVIRSERPRYSGRDPPANKPAILSAGTRVYDEYPKQSAGGAATSIKQPNVGLWMIGAGGRVAGTVALGLAAMRHKLSGIAGLVSELPPFLTLPLVAPAKIRVGGHEIRSMTFVESVQEARSLAGLFSPELIAACKPDLSRFQRNVRSGTTCGLSAAVRELLNGDPVAADRSAAAAAERLADDIRQFRSREKLDVVVVINLASTEPAAMLEQHVAATTLQPSANGNAAKNSRRRSVHPADRSSRRALRRRAGLTGMPTSSIYALAAIEAGCPYINFTPSTGIMLPQLRAIAEERGLPYMGNDGKTGETLVKSALAPMFAMRHLPVLSWVGQNLLGNRDGEVLRDPQTLASKVRSKDRVVSQIVQGSPTTKVSIEYVPSLDDWKVAWDFIHFEGFLGTRMSMQFTWQGCDSILAAPLVIDLARFAALEFQRGAVGPMHHLGFFFKDPIGVDEHDLATQWQRLVGLASSRGARTTVPGPIARSPNRHSAR